MFIHKLPPNVFHCIYRRSLAKKKHISSSSWGFHPWGDPQWWWRFALWSFYGNSRLFDSLFFSIRHPKMVVPKIGLPLKYLKSMAVSIGIVHYHPAMGPWDPWKCRKMPGPQASSGYSLELQSHDYPASCEVTTLGRFDVWHSGMMGCT